MSARIINGKAFAERLSGRIVSATDADHERAKSLAAAMNKKLAFVAVALRKSDNSYAAYFGDLETIRFPRSILMLPADRSKYRQLGPYAHDKRVAEFFS